ncbi:predicted protein [Streptomyces viridosporus ATCC 14672]|uniref:Predicted protein n=1 Tax=Streptomyces viridosporus (strain ATCC 14672 / DSM 40746 / JCM 4963 / KCTC 9882 / NRRL B-12104 / FH 1290) TaxID=566461 RepID=D5ZNR3_STRV1|nr:predicted protein [Streptomyces viridosporus ATCC 14672]
MVVPGTGRHGLPSAPHARACPFVRLFAAPTARGGVPRLLSAALCLCRRSAQAASSRLAHPLTAYRQCRGGRQRQPLGAVVQRIRAAAPSLPPRGVLQPLSRLRQHPSPHNFTVSSPRRYCQRFRDHSTGAT